MSIPYIAVNFVALNFVVLQIQFVGLIFMVAAD